MHSLFEGRGSLREPSERLAFWLTALFALPVALAIGYVLHESIGASQAALFIVIAMVYVTLARGRLLGSSVRVHQRQYPRVFTIVQQACAALEIPMPMIFVREDNYVPVVALGFGEPYSLVVSSHWVELFRDDELAFMVGRELGHIAAGHTRFHSLLSVNGNENPIVSLIFGAWLRRCALTCDKVGLLCCGSLDAAIRAMGISAFHEFGRKVDYEAFAEQHADVQNDSVLRLGEWLSSEPYATRRITSLRTFMATEAYARAEVWFLRERGEEPPALAAPGEFHVAPRDCAGWWRRFTAWGIDVVVVSAIITSFGGNVAGVGAHTDTNVAVNPGTVKVSAPGVGTFTINGKKKTWTNPLMATPSTAPSPAPNEEATVGPFAISDQGVAVKAGGKELPLSVDTVAGIIGGFIGRLGFLFWFPVYLGALVIVGGQTFGMLIAGLRVVTTDYAKPSVARTIARYFIVFCLWPLIMLLSLFWRRILLHDRWTKTRVVKVERVVARIVGTT
ncbi:MAG: RDD family protein [Candidatus Eremiobacteraeota bacterium]|nr:RDD family protein [Candidatus Eremiobacteraeota bacterium]